MVSSARARCGVLEAGRGPVPSRPVVVTAIGRGDAAEPLVRSGTDRDWQPVFEKDLERVTWAVSVRQAAALVLIADAVGWVVRFVSELRAMSATPVVVVAAPGTDGVVAALAAGVDTVLPPPTTGPEILARTYAIIRRPDERHAPTTRYLLAGQLSVNGWRRRTRLGDREPKLTATGFDQLSLLTPHPGRILAPRAILSHVWGTQGTDGLNTPRDFVGRLRGERGAVARTATYVQSIRGQGWRFAVPVVEVPDEERAGLTDESGRAWLDAIAEIGSNLGRVHNVDDLARTLLDGLVGIGIADGVAVQHVADGRLRAHAHWGMSKEGPAEFGDMSLSDEELASSRAVLTRRPFQVPRAHGYRSTTTALKAGDLRAGPFLPVAAGPGGETPTCLGLAHRDIDACRPSTLGLAIALCAVYGAHLAARRCPPG